MNGIGLTGMALIVLGLAGVFSTAAGTAVIPAVFGLIFLGLALWGRTPARAGRATTGAAAVAVLAILAVLGNLARTLSTSGLVLNAALFANLSMAMICGLYLAYWAWERNGGAMGRKP